MALYCPDADQAADKSRFIGKFGRMVTVLALREVTIHHGHRAKPSIS